MPGREFPLVTGEIYHIFNRGITDQIVFSAPRDYERALATIRYYQQLTHPLRYSYFVRLQPSQKDQYLLLQSQSSEFQLKILAYCLMPNHFHFLVQQTHDCGVSTFIGQLINSYTRYFNTKKHRVGPLFQGRFKAVAIESEAQLIHVSRYIHLNPYSGGLIKLSSELDNYPYSSFHEYLAPDKFSLCDRHMILGLFVSTSDYKNFVLNQSDHQRQLQCIKHLLLDI